MKANEWQGMDERIRALADRLDPPPVSNDLEQAFIGHTQRYVARRDLLAIATPGARLGALVDLFDHALANEWSWSLYDIVGKWESVRLWNGGTGRDILTNGPTPAAALLAAMEQTLPPESPA